MPDGTLQHTCIPIVEHVERLTRMESQIAALDRATDIAKDAIDRRLTAMNEFREALNDAQNRMLPRAEYAIQHERLVDDVKRLNTFKDQLVGKANQSSVNLALAGMVIGWIFAIIGILLHFIS